MILIAAAVLSATILACAAASDLRNYRIPNVLILTGYAAGGAYLCSLNGVQGVFMLFARALIPIIALYVLFLIGAVGAGDIKLFSVLSVFQGLSDTTKIIILSFAVGAVFALFKLLKSREFLPRMANLFSYFTNCITQKRLYSYSGIGSGNRLHFSLSILIGYIIFCLFGTGALQDMF